MLRSVWCGSARGWGPGEGQQVDADGARRAAPGGGGGGNRGAAGRGLAHQRGQQRQRRLKLLLGHVLLGGGASLEAQLDAQPPNLTGGEREGGRHTLPLCLLQPRRAPPPSAGRWSSCARRCWPVSRPAAAPQSPAHEGGQGRTSMAARVRVRVRACTVSLDSMMQKLFGSADVSAGGSSSP